MIAFTRAAHEQHYPRPGLVEHDAEEIWHSQLSALTKLLEQLDASPKDIAAIGITNQRETVVVWERITGKPICPAIVWQDRRTAEHCRQLKEADVEKSLTAITGLCADPYFSATKISWILDHIDGARTKAEKGELCAGTIDSWLIWNLTAHKAHVTDATNASRTLLYNLHTGSWDPDLLKLFDIPASMLPEIVDSSSEGVGDWQGVPICGIVGDQQAALFGQGCTEPSMIKNTYGTGCFMLLNTGHRVIQSKNRLLSTVAWQIGGKRTFALEGSVFMGGAIFNWLRDGIGLVEDIYDFDHHAKSVKDSGGVVLVPGMTGLGAPHWDPHATGAFLGMTRGTTKGHLCRAALDAVSFRCTEMLACMEKDAQTTIKELRVDGGASLSKLLLQIQADQLQRRIFRPTNLETTALGAAALAGLGCGFWEHAPSPNGEKDITFTPNPWTEALAIEKETWDKAVSRATAWNHA